MIGWEKRLLTSFEARTHHVKISIKYPTGVAVAIKSNKMTEEMDWNHWKVTWSKSSSASKLECLRAW